MKLLVLNPILFTVEKNGRFPETKSIKDTMIYGMCIGFNNLGHQVTLAAAAEYKPSIDELYDFDVKFFKSDYIKFAKPNMIPYSKELKSFLKLHFKEYDIVISSEVFSFGSLFASLICPEKTLIWHELALHPLKFHKIPSKLWYNVIARTFMRKVLVVPRSEKAKQFISKYMNSISEKNVEHGLDISKFEFNVPKSKQFIVIS